MCATSPLERLDLRETSPTDTVFYPDLVEVDFVLSSSADSDSANPSSRGQTTLASSSDTSNDTHVSASGVIWAASASGKREDITWTVFPSSGLLPPGKRCVRLKDDGTTFGDESAPVDVVKHFPGLMILWNRVYGLFQ